MRRTSYHSSQLINFSGEGLHSLCTSYFGGVREERRALSYQGRLDWKKMFWQLHLGELSRSRYGESQ